MILRFLLAATPMVGADIGVFTRNRRATDTGEPSMEAVEND